MAQRPRPLQPNLSDRHLLGARLRSLREDHHLSQARLGELVFCSGHLIGKVEKAERRAQPDLIRRCDDVLDAGGQLVGLLDGADVERIKARRAHYEHMYRHVGGVPVGPRIEAFLRLEAGPMLRDLRDGEPGRRLRLAVGGLLAMAGICAYDAERQKLAAKHFHRALELSADEITLAGYVRALMANQALCLNNPRLAIRHARCALQQAKGGLSAALRTDLHAMQAKAYATMGRRAECLAQLHDAETAVGAITAGNEPIETSYVHPGLLELKEAEALLRLGDLEQAQRFAETSLMLGPPDPRGSFYAYATLAQACAARREVEQSLTWARKALEMSRGMESWRVVDRLRIVIESLEPYGDVRAVRELLAQARQTLVVPF